MKELRIKYEDKKTLDLLLKMLDNLGVAYNFSELEKNEITKINGVELIEGDGIFNVDEMIEIFTKMNLDPVNLR
jgi:molecular chaperone GrpE (heat shock protein)